MASATISESEPRCATEVSQVVYCLPGQGGAIITAVPRVKTFSGDLSAKSDISFKQWHYEIVSLVGVYNETIIKEVITRSLKGAVADTVRFFRSKGYSSRDL